MVDIVADLSRASLLRFMSDAQRVPTGHKASDNPARAEFLFGLVLFGLVDVARGECGFTRSEGGASFAAAGICATAVALRLAAQPNCTNGPRLRAEHECRASRGILHRGSAEDVARIAVAFGRNESGRASVLETLALILEALRLRQLRAPLAGESRFDCNRRIPWRFSGLTVGDVRFSGRVLLARYSFPLFG
jgi:hypothetical protein